MDQEAAGEERVPEWVKLVMSLICDEDVRETREMIERSKREESQS